MLKRLWARLRCERGGVGTRSVIVGAVLGAAVLAGGYAPGGGGGDTDCPLPAYPDASCTGVPSGTSLTAYTGPTTITVADTVIDGKLIEDCLLIQAANVTIRNSRLDGPCDRAILVPNTHPSASVTVEDSEILCQNTEGSHGLAFHDLTVVRSEITECENGLSVDSDAVVEDSYIHALSNAGDDPHSDGMQFGASTPNVQIIHNTIFGMQGAADDQFGTSSLIADLTGHSNWLIEHNLFGGGAFTVYCVVGTGTNWILRNNAFTNRFSEAYGEPGGEDNIGFFGHSNQCGDQAATGSTGNFYYESGLPLTLG